MKLTEKARVYGDAAIAIVSSLGISAGILLASVAGGFNIDLFSYLFGNILAIGRAEVVSSIVLSRNPHPGNRGILSRHDFRDPRRGICESGRNKGQGDEHGARAHHRPSRSFSPCGSWE